MEKLSFKQYVENIKLCESIINESIDEDWYFEDFCDAVISHGLSLEAVMTGDIAGITHPLGLMKRKMVYESAPPGEEAERFILKNKGPFKKRYGKDYEQVLYATAWKIFGNK